MTKINKPRPCKSCNKLLPRDIYHYYKNSGNTGDGFERVCRKCTLSKRKIVYAAK